MENKSKGLSATSLFAIAFVLLFINHFCFAYDDYVGMSHTLSELQWFITRPYCILFYFLIAESMYRTKDRKKFILALLVLAVASECIYDKLFNHVYFDFTDQNDAFDFFMCALSIFVYDKFNGKKTLQILSVIVLCVISWVTNLSGNVIAILSTLTFHILRDDKRKPYVAAIVIVVATFMLYAVWVLQGRVVPEKSLYFSIQQAFAVFAIPLIAKYNGQIGNLPKWAYYAFYPAHLLFIVLVFSLVV